MAESEKATPLRWSLAEVVARICTPAGYSSQAVKVASDKAAEMAMAAVPPYDGPRNDYSAIAMCRMKRLRTAVDHRDKILRALT